MSLTNKSGDMTPFDMQQKPCRQNAFLLPLIWGLSYIATRKNRLRIRKLNMDGLKPPYLVLSTHQGFSDYYIAPLAVFPHRANYVSDMEGFAAFGKGLYRAAGCIGKRRYVSDISVMKNILYVVRQNRDVIVLFPESRHSNVGTTSLIPDNMGKFCKFLNVPVVTLSVHGSYLASPFWDEQHVRKAPIEATMECVCTQDQLTAFSADELQQIIAHRLTYDEYAWQRNNHISITGKTLAEGLHKALYQCRSCGAEFSMASCGSKLRCDACGAEWIYSEFGELVKGDEHIHIPDWYEWQRENVIRRIDDGLYAEQFAVRAEALPNEKGFVLLGEGTLTHTTDGFSLILSDKTLTFPIRTLESAQTEYDYRGNGPCIVLSTKDCCYYLYSRDREFNPTKLQFAAEYLHLTVRN